MQKIALETQRKRLDVWGLVSGTPLDAEPGLTTSPETRPHPTAKGARATGIPPKASARRSGRRVEEAGSGESRRVGPARADQPRSGARPHANHFREPRSGCETRVRGAAPPSASARGCRALTVYQRPVPTPI